MKKKIVRSDRQKVEVSIAKEVSATKHVWFDYRNMYTGLMTPMNPDGIKRISTDLVQWAKESPDAYKLSQFYLERGISKPTWDMWIGRFPELLEAHNTAKMIIGNRRELGALKGELHGSVVSYTMPFYDQEWKDETVRRAALKESNSDSRTAVVVNMLPIPNSPLVPTRDRDEM
jgi:hypothetical protein